MASGGGRRASRVLPTLPLVALTTLAHASDFYVDPAGSDANDGTSPATAFTTIQRAVDLAFAGDVVHLAAGSYLQDVVSRRDGTPGSPIALTGPPTAIVRGAGGSRMVQIHHDHLTLEGFTIDGRWGSPATAAGYRDELLYAIGTAPEQLDDGRNPTDDPDASNGNWIHHNTFDPRGNECVDVKEASSGNVVEHNSCTGQRDPDSGGFDARGSGNVFRFNETFGNLGAGRAARRRRGRRRHRQRRLRQPHPRQRRGRHQVHGRPAGIGLQQRGGR